MKKLFILGAACLFAQGVLAQQAIKFSMSYLPSKNYAITYKMDMDMNMTVGDETAAKAMKDAGQPTGMLMKMNMDMTADMTTGAQKNKTDVPFVMSYKNVGINMSMNGQNVPIPQTDLKGFNFEGYYSNATKKLKIETIQGNAADPAKTAAAEAQLAQIFNQYNFPDTTLKIGDSFEQNMPLSVPTAGGNADVMTKIKYTLKEVKGNQAIFDMNQVLDMNMDLPQGGGQMVMKGTGTGNMIYDTVIKFPVSSTISMDFTYKMTANGTPIVGNMKGLGVTAIQVANKKF